MVTSKGVGLAVPDWPTTFGYNMFLFPFSKWVGGVLFEHTHRLIASVVGFLTIVLALWLWFRERRRWVRNLGLFAVGSVILQGILGGLRVTMLKDEIGIFHACLAQAFFGLLVIIAIATSRVWDAVPVPVNTVTKISRIAVATTAVIYLQLALGATMRHQHRDLAVPDFPTAYHAWIPDTSPRALAAINAWRDTQALSDVTAFQIWLHMAHRFGALLAAAGIITFFIAVRKDALYPHVIRRLSSVWLLLVFCQVALGAWTIWSNKAADIATAHVAVGAIIFALGTAICALCLRSDDDSHVSSGKTTGMSQVAAVAR